MSGFKALVAWSPHSKALYTLYIPCTPQWGGGGQRSVSDNVKELGMNGV